MRLWSLHPKYLDVKGLTALWREGLLARKVLRGKTKGYRNHPQLIRFREQKNPLYAIDAYLTAVLDEAIRRGYKYDANKIRRLNPGKKIRVSEGQVNYEAAHLAQKLKKRSPEMLKNLPEKPGLNPVFARKPGSIEKWEKT